MTISINSNNPSLGVSSPQTSTSKTVSTPFYKFLPPASIPQAIQPTPQATPELAVSSTAYDPFASVRSGAVSESNSFVLALEDMLGIAEGSITGIQIPSKTQDATPIETKSISSEPDSTASNLSALAAVDQSQSVSNSMSEVIADSLEKSATVVGTSIAVDALLGNLNKPDGKS